jgi:S-adenosylmethionine decarboxylase proenzyme
MFQSFTTAGKHLISDLKNIQNIELLNDLKSLKQLCEHICFLNNFSILGMLEHAFHPEGFSFIFLLSESHMSIHTFPEKRFVSFDLYTCRQYDNNDVYLNIHKMLVDALNASEHSSLQIVERTF